MTTIVSTEPQAAQRAADESRDWVSALRATGPEHDEAVGRLHDLLLRASRFEIGRRRPEWRGARDELDDIAQQAASDALMAILAKLDTFRGDSRFTTWAYKFALLEAAVKVRKHAWRHRDVTLDDAHQAQLVDHNLSVADSAEESELVGAIGSAIRSELTPHQRRVLVAITLDGVPIDVLAERLGTNRGALYKTLHDARRKLRAHLAANGMEVNGNG